MKRTRVALASLCIGLAALAVQGRSVAQSEPYKVFDTRPVITEGPYLSALSDTSVSVMWMTDAPSHAKVRLHDDGNVREIEPQIDGLVPVGQRHVVTITGLAPGKRYSYEAVATRVVKLKPYWPDKGLSSSSPAATFTTFDPRQARVSFSVVTDTHEDTARIGRLMKLVDWSRTDALLHLGDAFHWLESEEQLWAKWLRPTVAAMGPGKPLLFARGNHELRGAYARQLAGYVPTPEGSYYYARALGPVHLMVLDTAEDKPDDTNVYAQLNRTAPYREEELAWLRGQVGSNGHFASAAFRVVAMHQGDWGWLPDNGAAWTALANQAGIDLLIAGHDHAFSYQPPDKVHAYHRLILGQDQLARVEATGRTLTVKVLTDKGAPVHTLTIPSRR
ncbi:Calcineurin-like phosphoesterase [Duganella sp. CF458]|uniref:FN3 domain-containing metallophosphoesterase family protein n=1 Tax=Duganella sp. CF458 TaxID=1884368 RepID=UPI0008E943AD|nr:FN3 domain-containing metallophosphoesterase family protein [Duganella sp. CF458]SFG37065.1 Calcineurin-like phosphoesterase [Duganella sp. CF458]